VNALKTVFADAMLAGRVMTACNRSHALAIATIMALALRAVLASVRMDGQVQTAQPSSLVPESHESVLAEAGASTTVHAIVPQGSSAKLARGVSRNAQVIAPVMVLAAHYRSVRATLAGPARRVMRSCIRLR